MLENYATIVGNSLRNHHTIKSYVQEIFHVQNYITEDLVMSERFAGKSIEYLCHTFLFRTSFPRVYQFLRNAEKKVSQNYVVGGGIGNCDGRIGERSGMRSMKHFADCLNSKCIMLLADYFLIRCINILLWHFGSLHNGQQE